jgi:hypothetical protein
VSAVSSAFESIRQIGRHFAVVAGLPALVVTTELAVLLGMGAPSQRPDIDQLATAGSSIGLAGFGLLLVAVIVVGLTLQPLQFAFTQVLEGYWGPSTLALRAMRRSATRHLIRLERLDSLSDRAAWDVEDGDRELAALTQEEEELSKSFRYTFDDAERISQRRRFLHRKYMLNRLTRQEADRARERYPLAVIDLMPTALGNVLRRYERVAGDAYGLESVVTTGLLAQVADTTMRDYHDDARTDLDLATQTVLMWVAATTIGVIFLWRYDVWLLIPMMTGLLSILAYRGATASAAAYGEALMVLFSLGRSNLYAALRIPQPANSDEEIARNALVTAQLFGERVSLDYRREQE